MSSGQTVLVTNARVTGPITVNPGGALSIVSSRIGGGITATGPSAFSLCSSEVAGAVVVAGATTAVRIGDPGAGCAGNRFSGVVRLTGNTAVTFGANFAALNVTVAANGPGNTVIKGNSLPGGLACTGNNPAPTNAGQPNVGAPKTGQCAAL